MTLEDMRTELIVDVKGAVGENVQVVRGGTDIDVNFPRVTIDFMGQTQRYWAGIGMSVTGDRENWSMIEPVSFTIYTIEKRDGIDDSRGELQDLVDLLEYHIRKEWPAILKTHQCAIHYPSSFYNVTDNFFYNERRVNTSTTKISIIEPRYPTESSERGPLVERATVTSAPLLGENVTVTIEDD